MGKPSDAPGPHSAPVSQSQDCIAAALACSKILKELSKEEEDTDSSEEMLALADEFEHRAIGELPGATCMVTRVSISVCQLQCCYLESSSMTWMFPDSTYELVLAYVLPLLRVPLLALWLSQALFFLPLLRCLH